MTNIKNKQLIKEIKTCIKAHQSHVYMLLFRSGEDNYIYHPIKEEKPLPSSTKKDAEKWFDDLETIAQKHGVDMLVGTWMIGGGQMVVVMSKDAFDKYKTGKNNA